MITPRLDSVQEVTVSTAAAGADSTGAGAVQIKFVTRSGNNEYHGSLYEYMRNPWLNANYWFNNRNNAPVYQGDGEGRGQNCTIDQLVNEWENCKAPRDRVMLHQLGVRVGGPISIPKLFSGKDRLFFFANWENFRQPDGQTRTRTIYNPLVEQGNYVYLFKQSGQPDQVKSQNLLTLAAANGFTSTMDPTVQKLLSDIRNAVGDDGNHPVVSDGGGSAVPEFHFPEQRDGNPSLCHDARRLQLSSRHKIEQSWNYAYYDSNPDFLNSRDQRYPGFPNYGTQASNRCSTSFALRSTITPRLVNEARGGIHLRDDAVQSERRIPAFSTANRTGSAIWAVTTGRPGHYGRFGGFVPEPAQRSGEVVRGHADLDEGRAQLEFRRHLPACGQLGVGPDAGAIDRLRPAERLRSGLRDVRFQQREDQLPELDREPAEHRGQPVCLADGARHGDQRQRGPE